MVVDDISGFSLWYAVRKRGNPWRGFPLFSAELKIHPFLRFLNAWGISLTAVSDQGRRPWTLVAFVKAPQNFIGPAGLEFW